MAERVNHMPPEPGITEIRVHGVGGADPTATLGRTDVFQVTGDATAGFFRPTIPLSPNRTVEAYSWGGLTAGSRARALWVLLLPFALVNLAGWMVEPIPSINAEGRSIPVRFMAWAAGKLETAQRVLVHVTGLAITGAYVMWIALMTMDLLAYQCGSQAACTTGRFYAEWLGREFFVDHPGRRIVVAALAPIGLIILFGIISSVSRARFEGYTASRAQRDLTEVTPVLSSDMGDRMFWQTSQWHARLFRAHLAWALAFLGGITAYASWRFIDTVPGNTTAAYYRVPAVVTFSASIVLAVAVVVYIALSVTWEDDPYETRFRFLNTGSNWTWWSGVAIVVAAMAVAWQLRVDDAVIARNTITDDLWGFSWTPILLFVLAVVCVLAFSSVEVAKWVVTCLVNPRLFFIAIAAVMVIAWQWAPLVFAATIVLALGARYVERRLCETPSPDREWIEVGAATIALVVLWVVGRLWWDGTVWGTEWPRLTPLIATGLVTLSFYLRRVGTAGAAMGRTFPIRVSGVVMLAAVLLWRILGRADPIYLGLYTCWVVISFFWVAVEPSERFRWNGPGAVALLAVTLTAGSFSGGLIRFATMLSGDGYTIIAVPIYDWIAVGFVSVFAAGLVAFIAWVVMARATHGSAAAAEFLERRDARPTDSEPIPEIVARRVKNWVGLARGIEAVDVFIMHVASLALYAVLALMFDLLDSDLGVTSYLDRAIGASFQGLTSVAAWVTLTLVLGMVLAVRSGLRDAGFRRQIGIVWDVTSFWPRHFHPLAPPSYAVRTVPELQSRVSEIAAADGKTILSGHSQGSVVSFAAAASLDDSDLDTVMLVTHGSPLRRFYARFFPKYFSDELLASTVARLGPGTEPTAGHWVNFYRVTDPIGQPISIMPSAVNEPPEPIADALDGILDNLPDVRLDDPFSVVWQPYQLPPDVLWHVGYLSDPRMADTLDAMSDVLTEAD